MPESTEDFNEIVEQEMVSIYGLTTEERVSVKNTIAQKRRENLLKLRRILDEQLEEIPADKELVSVQEPRRKYFAKRISDPKEFLDRILPSEEKDAMTVRDIVDLALSKKTFFDRRNKTRRQLSMIISNVLRMNEDDYACTRHKPKKWFKK